MPISLDAVTTGSTGTSPATSLSFSHTIGTVLARLGLVAAVSLRAQSGATLSAITCTWNSVSMIPAVSVYQSGSNNAGVAMFILTNPATGTKTGAFSWSGGAIGRGYFASLYDVNLANMLRSTSTITETSSGSPSQSPSSLLGDMVFDIIASGDLFGGSGTLTVGGSQTELLNGNLQSSNRMISGGSRRDGSNGSTSMSWTDTGSNSLVAAALSIIPAAQKGQPIVSPFFS